MTKRFIPEPNGIKKNPTYRDQLEWDQERIAQLNIAMVNLINDRRELRTICNN